MIPLRRASASRPQIAQVVAAEHVVAREVVLPQHLGQHERVGVGAVRGQEHQRVLGVQFAQRLQAAGVGVHLPRVVVHRAQDPGEQVDRGRVDRRDEALQVLLRLGGDVGLGPAGLRREAADLAGEGRPADDLVADLARDLGAVAEHLALGAVERELGLLGDEADEVLGVRAHPLAAVPDEQLPRGGRASDDDAVAQPVGPALVGTRGPRPLTQLRPPGHDVQQPDQRLLGRRPHRLPHQPHRDEQGVVAPRQPARELLTLGGHGLDRAPVRRPRTGEPPVDEPPLEDARRVDEDHQRPVPGVGQRRRVRGQLGDPRRAHCVERTRRAGPTGRVRGGRGDGRGLHGAPPAT